MNDPDMIITMDWIGKYEVVIDCKNEEITMVGPKCIKVAYRGLKS